MMAATGVDKDRPRAMTSTTYLGLLLVGIQVLGFVAAIHAVLTVRFAYEWHDDSGNWFRSYGNENWAFDEQGLMYERHASINDLPIREDQRLFRWPLGRRPDNHPSLGELGL